MVVVELLMGDFVGIAIGLLLAVFGFLVMRNPLILRLLSPGAEGYYQRLVLDTSQRNQLRGVGAMCSLFGIGISTEALGSLLRWQCLRDIADAFWVLMALMFAAAFCAGVVMAAKQIFSGDSRGSFDWFRAWKTGMQLGPMTISPSITPQMRHEATSFTIAFLALLLLAAIAALLR